MHNEAPDEDIKNKYYAKLWNIWFENVPSNAQMAANQTTKASFMDSGYFSYEINDSLSVLMINSLYMSFEDDPSYQLNEASLQLDWLEAQLEYGKNTGRQFIIAGHIYAGVRYHSNQMWMDSYTERYF